MMRGTNSFQLNENVAPSSFSRSLESSDYQALLVGVCVIGLLNIVGIPCIISALQRYNRNIRCRHEEGNENFVEDSPKTTSTITTTTETGPTEFSSAPESTVIDEPSSSSHRLDAVKRKSVLWKWGSRMRCSPGNKSDAKGDGVEPAKRGTVSDETLFVERADLTRPIELSDDGKEGSNGKDGLMNDIFENLNRGGEMEYSPKLRGVCSMGTEGDGVELLLDQRNRNVEEGRSKAQAQARAIEVDIRPQEEVEKDTLLVHRSVVHSSVRRKRRKLRRSTEMEFQRRHRGGGGGGGSHRGMRSTGESSDESSASIRLTWSDDGWVQKNPLMMVGRTAPLEISVPVSVCASSSDEEYVQHNGGNDNAAMFKASSGNICRDLVMGLIPLTLTHAMPSHAVQVFRLIQYGLVGHYIGINALSTMAVVDLWLGLSDSLFTSVTVSVPSSSSQRGQYNHESDNFERRHPPRIRSLIAYLILSGISTLCWKAAVPRLMQWSGVVLEELAGKYAVVATGSLAVGGVTEWVLRLRRSDMWGAVGRVFCGAVKTVTVAGFVIFVEGMDATSVAYLNLAIGAPLAVILCLVSTFVSSSVSTSAMHDNSFENDDDRFCVGPRMLLRSAIGTILSWGGSWEMLWFLLAYSMSSSSSLDEEAKALTLTAWALLHPVWLAYVTVADGMAEAAYSTTMELRVAECAPRPHTRIESHIQEKEGDHGLTTVAQRWAHRCVGLGTGVAVMTGGVGLWRLSHVLAKRLTESEALQGILANEALPLVRLATIPMAHAALCGGVLRTVVRSRHQFTTAVLVGWVITLPTGWTLSRTHGIRGTALALLLGQVLQDTVRSVLLYGHGDWTTSPLGRCGRVWYDDHECHYNYGPNAEDQPYMSDSDSSNSSSSSSALGGVEEARDVHDHPNDDDDETTLSSVGVLNDRRPLDRVPSR